MLQVSTFPSREVLTSVCFEPGVKKIKAESESALPSASPPSTCSLPAAKCGRRSLRTLAEFFLDLEALECPPAVEEEHFLWCAWTGGARPVTALEKFAVRPEPHHPFISLQPFFAACFRNLWPTLILFMQLLISGTVGLAAARLGWQ